jgi:tRNA(Ile)-lysidine synthase
MAMADSPARADLLSYVASVLDAARVSRGMPIAVAVSGGADSVALAVLMARYCDTAAQITTLTVDHGLRADSYSEACCVAKWMKVCGLSHVILGTASIDASRNLQAHARAARYGALLDYCSAHSIKTLLIAHHADDQAETVALQRHRGDTPPSRCGMALVRMERGVKLVRPLLGVRKTELMDYLRTLEQPWIDDPSNHSDRHARNRVRVGMDDATMRELWYEAQAMGKARHDQETARNHWIHSHIKIDAAGRYNLPFQTWCEIPELVASDLLAHVIHVCGGKPFRPRFHETTGLIERIRSRHAGAATLGYCKVTWNHKDDEILIRREATRPPPLDRVESESHIEQDDALKRLEALPFWWFTAAPYF